MRVINGLEELEALAGAELGASGWLQVTQDMVDQFAAVTRDHQWIHTDVQRATEHSPFGGTVAHGFLTLSLIPHLTHQIADVTGVSARINYGLERVRFPHPVRVGVQRPGGAACALDQADRRQLAASRQPGRRRNRRGG